MRDDLFPIDHNDYDNATRWAIRCLTHHCDPKGLAQVAVMATALLLQDHRYHTVQNEGLEAANAALKEENEKLKAELNAAADNYAALLNASDAPTETEEAAAKRHKRHPWTPGEDAYLTEKWELGVLGHMIAKQMGLRSNQIYSRAKVLGLSQRRVAGAA